MSSYYRIQNDKNVESSNFEEQQRLKLPCAFNKKRQLHPLLNRPTMNMYPQQENSGNLANQRVIAKRLLSAKDHKLKQLQNQLSNAHFHLNELSNENRLLRNLQKRLDSALQKYEGDDGGISKLVNSHGEEIKLWQSKHKQLKKQFKDTSHKLKEKDNELQQLQHEHKRLLVLSKDMKLAEREQLQKQVADLCNTVDRQNETITTLQRKISIESRNYKHKLNAEIAKHKESKTQLNDSIKCCEKLTEMLEKKDKLIAVAAIRRSPKVLKVKNETVNKTVDEGLVNFYLPLDESSLPNSHTSSNISIKMINTGSTFTQEEKKNENMNCPILEAPEKKSMVTKNDTGTDMNDLVCMEKHGIGTKSIVDKISPLSENNVKKGKYNLLNNEEESTLVEDIQLDEYLLDSDSPSDELKNITSHSNETVLNLKEEKHERDLIENILNDYCDKVVNDAIVGLNRNNSSNASIIQLESKKISEINNNGKGLKNKTINLDEEKKKKLLATLNAIDRGDDDGLTIETLKKSRTQVKSTNNNGRKNFFK